MLSNMEKKRLSGGVTKENRRDACSTRSQENTGESLLREDASSFAKATADVTKARLPASH
jgi:hypothetical protein